MTLLDDHRRPDAETAVRTMLHRLAADATTSPPAWERLIEREVAEVLPLAGPRPVPVTAVPRRRIDRRSWTIRAAAGVLVLAAAGALVANRAGSGPTEGPSPRAISAISPGEPGFDAGAAPEVWATGQADPAQATLAYLAAMGVPTDAAPPALALQGTADTTAVVDWSFGATADGSGGTVYLRLSSEAGAPPSWTVVGSSASDVALSEVRYDGSRLSFTVARTVAGPEQVAVGAWVDGQPVSLGGEPVAWAGSGDVSLGDLVELGADAGAATTFGLPVDADDVVTLRVVRVLDGTVRSLTQMAVALPDAVPAAVAAAPPVAAGGQADAGVAGNTGAATAEGDAGGSGGIQLAPGEVLPPLPQLPPLPVPLPNLLDPGAPPPTFPPPPTIPGLG
ncbi:MAG TPA: hypothetical protein VH479_23220 [Acidimicrobiales bacterium]